MIAEKVLTKILITSFLLQLFPAHQARTSCIFVVGPKKDSLRKFSKQRVIHTLDRINIISAAVVVVCLGSATPAWQKKVLNSTPSFLEFHWTIVLVCFLVVVVVVNLRFFKVDLFTFFMIDDINKHKLKQKQDGIFFTVGTNTVPPEREFLVMFPLLLLLLLLLWYWIQLLLIPNVVFFSHRMRTYPVLHCCCCCCCWWWYCSTILFSNGTMVSRHLEEWLLILNTPISRINLCIFFLLCPYSIWFFSSCCHCQWKKSCIEWISL